MAYASIHKEGNLLPKEKCDAIIKASTEIVEGKFDGYFKVDVFQTGSGTSTNLKRCSVALMKISEDLRLMASGPKCGLSEIEIPPLQAGSSIMAGKVNPVILEMVQMVSAQIIGFDLSNTICGMGGRFELNVMMPLLDL